MFCNILRSWKRAPLVQVIQWNLCNIDTLGLKVRYQASLCTLGVYGLYRCPYFLSVHINRFHCKANTHNAISVYHHGITMPETGESVGSSQKI